MNFYKKYETLNDIPEPFRRKCRAAEPTFFTPPEPTLKEAEAEPKSIPTPEAEPTPTYEGQSANPQAAGVHKGSQDLVFLMLMFMLLTE